MHIFNRSPEEFLWQSIPGLDSWLAEHGWEGYDPYVLKDAAIYRWIYRLPPDVSLPIRALRKALVTLELKVPLLMRQVLRVKYQINAKGMGLIVRGIIDLYQAVDKY